MNYRHVYMLIIEHAKSEQKLGIRKRGNGQYYENHHVLPKSLFPIWKYRSRNTVLLTAREHFFCHKLLVKIYPCQEMTAAIWTMANTNKDKVSSKEYEKLRLKFSQYLKESRKGENNPCFGRKLSDKEKLVLRNRMVGDSNIAKRKDVREKISASMLGNNHGTKNKGIKRGKQTEEQIRYRIQKMVESKLYQQSRKTRSIKMKAKLAQTKEQYKLYKEQGGQLSWNEWRKTQKG